MIRTAAFAIVGTIASVATFPWSRPARRWLVVIAGAVTALATGWAVSLLEVSTGLAAAVSYAITVALASVAAVVAGAALPFAPRLVQPARHASASVAGGLVRATQRVRSVRLSGHAAAVLACVAIGAGLRFWHLDRLGYSHWDENFYAGDAMRLASSLTTGWKTLGWYAPPGQAVSITLLFRVFGDVPAAAIGASALWGSLTVLALYALGRELFDRATGLVAAALLAVAPFALMYSRLALADAMFTAVFVISILFVQRALRVRTAGRVLLAGLACGLLLNTKYSAPFLFVAAPAWTVLDAINQAVTRRQRLAVVARTVAGKAAAFLIVSAIAVAVTIPFALHVRDVAGFDQLVHQVTGYSVASGPLLKTPLAVIGAYFTSFSGTALLVLAAAGVAIGAVRRTPGDLVLIVTGAGFGVLLMIYLAYPRLALPLYPLAALAAARAITEGSGRLRGDLRMPALALVTVAALVLELPTLPRTVGTEPDGYRQAAAFIDGHGGPDHVLTHLQPLIGLYGTDATPLGATADTRRVAAVPGTYVVFDQTIGWEAAAAEFVALNRDRMALVERIPNQLPAEVILQPASAERLGWLGHPPDAYRFIYVYRLTGPATLPDAWR